MTNHLCPVCFSTLDTRRVDFSTDRRDVGCPRCGRFSYSEEAEDYLTVQVAQQHSTRYLGERGSRARSNASAWLRQNPGQVITTKNFSRLVEIPTPSVLERATKLLEATESATLVVGGFVEVNQPAMLAASWALDSEELYGLTMILLEQGYIKHHPRAADLDTGSISISITGQGWKHLDDLHRSRSVGEQGFVAMWFDDRMNEVFSEAIGPAVEDAGYRPHRVDSREFEGRIDDEIIAQIRRSRFLVADFTGHRGSVYYEAGFAHGLDIPLFFTCRKTQMKKLQFDVRQYNTIAWKDHDDLRTRLQNRIEAVLGRGPLEPGGEHE